MSDAYDVQDFLFDLQGYLVLPSAVTATHLAALNEAFDSFPVLESGQW